MYLRFVVGSDSDQGHGIANQHGFDAFVDWGHAVQRRACVDVDQPRPDVFVHNEVEAI